MARRKKHPKLPNGYGSIKYLGKGRRNPYGVYPPITEFDKNGKAVSSHAICYVDDWLKGFAVLTAYKAGTYRISAYQTLDIHLKDKYFQGGIKTAAGKNRIVPIHSGIYQLVKNRMRRFGKMLAESRYLQGLNRFFLVNSGIHKNSGYLSSS